MGQPDSTACDFTEALGSRFSLLFYMQTRKHIGSRTYKQFCNYDGWAWWKWNKNEGSRAEKLIKLPEHLDQVLPGFLHLHHTINFFWCLSQFTLHFLLFTTENTLTDKASRLKAFILTEIWKGCRSVGYSKVTTLSYQWENMFMNTQGILNKKRQSATKPVQTNSSTQDTQKYLS